MPIALSRLFLKVITLRRYGSSPGAEGKDPAFAIFSEMTRKRVPCARIPAEEIRIVLKISSIFYFVPKPICKLLLLAYSHFNQGQMLFIKLRH